jgi:hypothetical protein
LFEDITKEILGRIEKGEINLEFDSTIGIKMGAKLKKKISVPNKIEL